MKQMIQIKHDKVKNPNWREANWLVSSYSRLLLLKEMLFVHYRFILL